MKSKHLTDLEISELLDGFYTLTPKQKEHIEHCSLCRQRLDEWRNLSLAIQQLPNIEPRNAINENILIRIKDINIQEQQYQLTTTSRFKIALALTSIIVLVISLFLIPSYFRNEQKSNLVTSLQYPNDNMQGRQSITSSSEYDSDSYQNDNDLALFLLTEEIASSQPLDEDYHNLGLSDLILSLADESNLYDYYSALDPI